MTTVDSNNNGNIGINGYGASVNATVDETAIGDCVNQDIKKSRFQSLSSLCCRRGLSSRRNTQ